MSPGPDPFLLFFYADGCADSASMAGVLQDVRQRFGETLPCIVLDVCSPLAKHHYSGITAAPSLVLMRGGKELWLGAGLLHSSEVIGAIEEAL